jgi:hypothetical protein
MSIVRPLSLGGDEWRCAMQDERNYAATCHPRWIAFIPATQPVRHLEAPCGLVAEGPDGSSITILFRAVSLPEARMSLGFCCERGELVEECVRAALAVIVDDWGFTTLQTKVPAGDAIVPLLSSCGFAVTATLRQHMRHRGAYRDVLSLMLKVPEEVTHAVTPTPQRSSS